METNCVFCESTLQWFCERALYNGDELFFSVRQPFTMETNCVFCETALYNGDELCFL